MASSKSFLTLNRSNWEGANFPMLCAACIGEFPYIRMMKDRYSRNCRMCARSFMVNRWFPGATTPFRKTEVCQPCAKLKSVCQACLRPNNRCPKQARDSAATNEGGKPKNGTRAGVAVGSDSDSSNGHCSDTQVRDDNKLTLQAP